VPRPPHRRNSAGGLWYGETLENGGYVERKRTKTKKLSLAFPLFNGSILYRRFGNGTLVLGAGFFRDRNWRDEARDGRDRFRDRAPPSTPWRLAVEAMQRSAIRPLVQRSEYAIHQGEWIAQDVKNAEIRVSCQTGASASPLTRVVRVGRITCAHAETQTRFSLEVLFFLAVSVEPRRPRRMPAVAFAGAYARRSRLWRRAYPAPETRPRRACFSPP
jgi:hypothetical protein